MDKKVQKRGRIKHMPAANDLLEQQIGWQGKQRCSSNSYRGTVSFCVNVPRDASTVWMAQTSNCENTPRAGRIWILTSLSHMSNGQFANATPYHRCESCYLTTLQPFKLLNGTTIKYSELERMWQGLPWSSVRHWTGNCYCKLRRTSPCHAHCATLRSNAWQKYQNRIRDCGLSVAILVRSVTRDIYHSMTHLLKSSHRKLSLCTPWRHKEQ